MYWAQVLTKNIMCQLSLQTSYMQFLFRKHYFQTQSTTVPQNNPWQASCKGSSTSKHNQFKRSSRLHIRIDGQSELRTHYCCMHPTASENILQRDFIYSDCMLTNLKSWMIHQTYFTIIRGKVSVAKVYTAVCFLFEPYPTPDIKHLEISILT